MKASERNNKDTKWVFLKQGTCSRTMFYILNREFDNPMDKEEQAADQLAGGILQQGYQCGLLWGTAFGISAEAYRRTNGNNKTISLALEASKAALTAFEEKAGSADCEDIINMDVSGTGGALKMLAKGKFITCFKLADRWAPLAIKVAKESLARDQAGFQPDALSCATETIKKMGGSEKEAAMAAGLAGGIGLSGKGCGALTAAIWYSTLVKVRRKDKVPYPDPDANRILEDFLKETDYRFECREICGRQFNSVTEHTEFINQGGCSNLINILAGNTK